MPPVIASSKSLLLNRIRSSDTTNATLSFSYFPFSISVKSCRAIAPKMVSRKYCDG